MAKYFKVIAIDKKAFIEATGQKLKKCCQLVAKCEDAVYAAINDDEEGELQINLNMFEEERQWLCICPVILQKWR